jgi:SH3 domain-containing YSC84-like protein 1
MKLALVTLLPAAFLFADAKTDVVKRIDAATTVLTETMNAGDKSIPSDIMEKAYCVGVIPAMKKGGFIFGGKYGRGLVSCRSTNSRQWSPISMIGVEGGSFGLQIGGGETDLIFAVMNESGMKKLLADKFTLGADAAAMAGPVGRDTSAMTDAMMHAQILSWSRARGVFGGATLEGSSLRAINDDNKALYGHTVTQQELLLNSKITPPVEANGFYALLNKYAFKPTTGD